MKSKIFFFGQKNGHTYDAYSKVVINPANVQFHNFGIAKSQVLTERPRLYKNFRQGAGFTWLNFQV